MFDSQLSVIFMECGHPIHKNCYSQYMATSYKCPLCNKSIVKMDAIFLNLANIIKEQPMPEEWKHMRSVVLCNDCSAKCSTPYHFLGLRCQNCQSFNTVELQRSPEPVLAPEATEPRDEHALPPTTQILSQDEAHSDGEDEDEEHDLWGRGPQSGSSQDGEDGDDDGEDDDEEEEESESEDDEHDEDIVLFGHR